MTIVNNAAGKSAGGTVIEEKWHSSRVFLMTRPITPIDGIRPTSFVNSIPNGFVVSRGKVSLITLNAHYYIVHFAAYLCRSTQETISVVFGVAIRFCVSFQLWSPNNKSWIVRIIILDAWKISLGLFVWKISYINNGRSIHSRLQYMENKMLCVFYFIRL